MHIIFLSLKSKKRKELYNYLHSKGILVQIHYIPIHLLPYYKKIGYENANLKNSENYYSRCISLPMYPTLKYNEQMLVIEEVLNFFSDE